MSKKVHSDLDLQNIARVRNAPTPVNADELVNRQYVDDKFGGLAWKDNVRVCPTGNINIASPGATHDGVTINAGDANKRMLLRNQTTAAENGLYDWNGAASALTRCDDANSAQELVNAVVIVDEGTTNAGTRWRQIITNITLGTTGLTFQSDAASSPAASETTSGVVELATQAEVDTGTDDLRVVTPLKLANWSGKAKRGALTFGDGTATQFDFTHNLGTRDVCAEVYRNSTPWDTIFCDISRPDGNTIRVNFATAPPANGYRITLTA